MIQGLQTRKTATTLLSAIIDQKTSLKALTDAQQGHPHYLHLAKKDRRLCRAILLAALRHRLTIQKQISSFLSRPLPKKALSLNHLLHVAAAQILYLNVPDHAALHIAVACAKQDKRMERFSGLVNALLRQIALQKGKISSSTINAPEWFYNLLQKDYGMEQATQILKQTEENVEPCLNINVKEKASYWAQKLHGVVLPLTAQNQQESGCLYLKPTQTPIEEQEGFQEGQWWVQNASASLPVLLMGDVTGKNILDLCAAPGGKTAQLALRGAHVTALDISSKRLQRLKENLERLKLSATLKEADALNFQPQQLFDAVLLDAPCSSTGTIRHQPDILWTKDLQSIERFAQLQYNLLDKAFSYIKKDGVLIFCNCSLFKKEGEEIIEKISNKRKDISLLPFTENELGDACKKFIDSTGCLRLTPSAFLYKGEFFGEFDGFFIARFKKL